MWDSNTVAALPHSAEMLFPARQDGLKVWRLFLGGEVIKEHWVISREQMRMGVPSSCRSR